MLTFVRELADLTAQRRGFFVSRCTRVFQGASVQSVGMETKRTRGERVELARAADSRLARSYL